MYACPSLGRAGQCGFGGRGVTVVPEVPIAAHEEPEQPPEAESSASEPAQEPLRRSHETENQLYLLIMKFIQVRMQTRKVIPPLSRKP